MTADLHSPCQVAPEVIALGSMQRSIVDALGAGPVEIEDLAALVGAYVDVHLWRAAVESLIGLGMIRIHNARAEAIPRTIFPSNRDHECTWKHWEYFKGVEA